MCFKANSLNDLFEPILCLNDVPLAFVTSNEYLDVIIHDKRDDNNDIMICAKSLYSKGNVVISRLTTCSSFQY